MRKDSPPQAHFKKLLRILLDLLREYGQLDSTNKEAARLIAGQQAVHGLGILAQEQTEGRGQYTRTWHTTPGKHLAFSIILLPEAMEVNSLPLLSLKTSLAIVRSLHILIDEKLCRIKWPNDIYANGRKLAGILIENAIASQKVRHSIIGIGLNVNEDSFPPDLSNATSLKLLTGKTYTLTELAERIRASVMSLVEDPSPNWKAEYDNYIFGKNEIHTFRKNEIDFDAEVLGVDVEGKLNLRHVDGRQRNYSNHEIKWVI